MSVIPGHLGSELIAELPDPPPGQGSVLVEGLLAGICGTDAEILRGGGQPPDGEPRLVIGHESLGRVLEAPADAPVRPGDLVAGVVRRPDPVPCPACAAGQWDFCVNGRYTERGIKGLDGYGATLWRVSPRFAIGVPDQLGDLGVLTEPGSVVAKAWEQIDRLVLRAPGPGSGRGSRSSPGPARSACSPPCSAASAATRCTSSTGSRPGPSRPWSRRSARPTTMGPAGTLEALDLCPDVALECTGAGELVVELAGKLAPAGVMCLIGISSGQRLLPVDMSRIGRSMVLGNSLVFGTVSAARRHYEQAVGALARADPAWLGGLISRRVPLSGWQQGLAREPDDVKVVVDLTQ